MLDQNTDRMWYVIGAVLVGAAIILIANGVLPELFATVTDSFSNVSSSATDEISRIGQRKELRKIYTLADMSKWREHQIMVEEFDNGAIIAPDETFRGGFYFTSDLFKKGSTYALEFDMQKISGDILGIGGHLTVSDRVDVLIDGKRTPMWDGYPYKEGNLIPLENEWNYPRQYPNDNERHHIELIFTVGDILWESNDKIYIQPNRLGEVWTYEEWAMDYEVLIENVMLYEYVDGGDE